MVTTCSPALQKMYGDLVSCTRKRRMWFCFRTLCRFFDLPEEAERYWVEGSTEQWPDKSGCRVLVRINEPNGDAEWRDGKKWDYLYLPLRARLAKLGVTGEKATSVYFRVWYRE